MTSNPPIVQLLLTVQFQPAVASLSILDWSDLRRLFADEFPVFAQIPRAGAMPTRLGQVVLETPFGLPRLSMTSSDLSQTLMIQDDRISVGWQRTVPLNADPKYPGFSVTVEGAVKIISKIMSFISEKATESVQFSVGELIYVDAFTTHKDGERYRNLGDIFTCIRSNKDFLFNNVNLIFRKDVAIDHGDEFDGIAETSISGFVQTPDGQIAVNMQTVVRFEFSGKNIDPIKDTYEKAHRVAVNIFSTLVKSEAYASSEQL